MLKKILNFFKPYEKVEVTSNLKMVEEPVKEPEPVVAVPVETVVPEAVVVEEPKAEPKPKKPRAKKATSKKSK